MEKREVDNVPISIHAKGLGLIKPILPSFKASNGWARAFLKRHSLVLRAKTSIAQALPDDLENRIHEFRHEVKRVRQNGDFPYDFIGNMDETPVYMDMVPSKTVDVRGKEPIKVKTTKSEKCRVTAVLSCIATGSMLSPMVIFKGTTGRSIHNIKESNGTVVCYQKKAWVDEKLMLQWISDIWVKHTKNKPSLLFLDSFITSL